MGDPYEIYSPPLADLARESIANPSGIDTAPSGNLGLDPVLFSDSIARYNAQVAANVGAYQTYQNTWFDDVVDGAAGVLDPLTKALGDLPAMLALIIKLLPWLLVLIALGYLLPLLPKKKEA